MKSQDILNFWFKEIPLTAWFRKDPKFDQTLRERFLTVLQSAARGELATWRTDIHGRLAEILVLDQFSRNIYRDKPQSFAQDPLAVQLAREALKDAGHDTLPAAQKSFLYMPFMHSESLVDHVLAVQLFSQPGLEGNLDFELRHKAIIEKFGRYPHRNWILGRPSTPQEVEFLKQPGSGF